jgi:hypothetical protein
MDTTEPTQDPRFNDVLDAVQGALYQRLIDMVHGSSDDLAVFVQEIGNDLVHAASIGRKDLLDELVAGLAMVAEKHRIKANRKSWEMAGIILDTAFSVATRLLSTAIIGGVPRITSV